MECPACLDPKESLKLSLLYFRKETYSLCVCRAKDGGFFLCTSLHAGAKKSFLYNNSSVKNLNLKVESGSEMFGNSELG